MAALIFPAGYYCASIFLQLKVCELYEGAVFVFTNRRGILWKCILKGHHFIGVNFEAGNLLRFGC